MTEQATPVAPAWWRTATVYQVYPRSFADSDGDGLGDLRGLVGRLDYLVTLGVDVVWLCPVYRSPQDDNGYDISDYRDVDPMFGTLDDVDELVRQAHARGIRIVMDLVVNHTSDEHPWFQASRDPADPRRGWYWWRPARPGTVPGTPGAEPNNWGSRFSGSAWTFDERSGEYYLHIFSAKQPDLNWEDPDLRQAVHQMMRWWLDRGIDGFRMDVINFIAKPTDLPDLPVLPGAPYANAETVYANGPRLHEFLQEMNREVFAGRGDRLMTVGETPGVTVEDARLLTDPDRHELDMVFQFQHVELDQGATKWDLRPFDLVALKRVLGHWQEGLADVGWNSLYWNNHDQPRIVSRWGDDGVHRVASAKLLATVLHLHRGTPYVLQGEELGMTNAPIRTIEDVTDIQSVNHYREAVERLGRDPEQVLASIRARGRDNSRSPMQWDATAGAGFTAGTPWAPVNPNHREINAAAQVDDPDSVFSHYRALIALRRTEPLVVEGAFRMLAPEHPRLYAFTRTSGERGLLVLANWSSDPLDVPDDVCAGWERARLVLGSLPGRAPSLEPTPVSLRPWEAIVLLREPS